MNQIQAKVEGIKSDAFFNIVHLGVNCEARLKLLKTELPQWLGVGDTVECHIAEAALSICKGDHNSDVSIENRIDATVKGVQKGDVLSEVRFDTQCGELKSLITTDAYERMEIENGEHVVLLLKAVDIKLAPIL
jgi:molybdate transport system regulatory protein